jgi:hypothetical protein
MDSQPRMPAEANRSTIDLTILNIHTGVGVVKMKSKFWIFLNLSILLIASNCTGRCARGFKQLKPEEVVEAYLNIALNMNDVSQRSELLEYTTGNLHDAIAEVSDETIAKAYVSKKYKLENYSLLERRDRTPRETEVSFQIRYKDLSQSAGGETQNAATITTENTVRVIKEKDDWLISDVIGNKTSIEFPDLKDMEIRASADGNTPPPPDEQPE